MGHSPMIWFVLYTGAQSITFFHSLLCILDRTHAWVFHLGALGEFKVYKIRLTYLHGGKRNMTTWMKVQCKLERETSIQVIGNEKQMVVKKNLKKGSKRYEWLIPRNSDFVMFHIKHCSYSPGMANNLDRIFMFGVHCLYRSDLSLCSF